MFVSDDYYDTEDPSVNLQDFIVNSMQVLAIITVNVHKNCVTLPSVVFLCSKSIP